MFCLGLHTLFRCLVTVLTIVNAFLLAYLYFGCQNTSHSSIYAARFSFNQSSPVLGLLADSYNSTVDLKLYVGFSGVCYKTTGAMQCTTQVDALEKKFPGIALYDSTSNSTAATLDIVRVASKFEDTVDPRAVLTNLVLILFTFGASAYTSLPFMPWKHVAQTVLAGVSLLAAIMCGFTTMWLHVAVETATRLISPGSMGVINVVAGNSAAAMAWTSFVFTLLVALAAIWLFVKSKRAEQPNNLRAKV
ncbi:unnamed protein product [Kuraishia capsulata CBS 1993]|uniref:Membrane fusion mating protein FIG1 n=1 Tax=Kuraishia capsulata CBS 1993 TaxID=1382522 RepID=W6MWM0_9ASCO|nr:uncharacterized protein KUCA_T00003624001 [Kuraishia capsulata CBS 1993]CDK27645.1 unnamed protein product [Kuraishia capsulata CBS 1993]